MPADATASEYKALLVAHHLAASLGYTSAAFQDHQHHLAILSGIHRHPTAHVDPSLTTAFIAANPVPERIAAPFIRSCSSKPPLQPAPTRWFHGQH